MALAILSPASKIAGTTPEKPRLPRLLRHAFTILAAATALCGAQESEPAATPVLSQDGSSTVNPLEHWIDALAIAESGNRERLVHRDRDGQLYYGCLQFQPRTFRVYVRKFHLLPHANRKEMMSRIYDCAFQKQLAVLMIRSDPAGWKHWRGTVENRVGLPPADPTP